MSLELSGFNLYSIKDKHIISSKREKKKKEKEDKLNK